MKPTPSWRCAPCILPMASTPPDEQAARGRRRLERLWRAGSAFLGSPLALMGGAMTWVSEHGLVAALSDAGGFGVLACGAMEPEQLAAEIAATQALTERPFGVNLIIMHPRLRELIDACGAHGVTHVVLAGGLPDRATMARVKDGGARLLCFAPSLAVARRLVRAGPDALIIEGMEAGGHIGPVATSVLAQEILPHLREVPVFVAGGIGHGEAIAAYLRMGASGCQMGTRFVETQLEVIARHRSGALSFEEASLAIEHFWAGALRRAVIDGDVENGSLMAGQSVGLVDKVQPLAEILDELVAQAVAALERERAFEPILPEAAE